MTQREESNTQPVSRRRRDRKPRREEGIGRFWAKWRVEIVIVLLIALAVFLLVERMQIRQSLWALLRKGYEVLLGLVGSVQDWLVNLVRNTTISDLTAYVLLLVVLVVMAWRIRWRLMRAQRLTGQECPRCGSDLRRTHRRWRDRLVNLYLPVRRYGCNGRGCSWSGLRVAVRRHD